MFSNKSVLFVLLAALLNAGSSIAHAQISGGLNFPCSDDQVDAIAICASHIVCTHPPDPIDAFDIGARAFASCPNQPVDNFAGVDAKIGGVQAVSTAQARALGFNRLIHREIRAGDCAGKTVLLDLTDDPQGCNPPPPPPPAGGGGGCDQFLGGGDGPAPLQTCGDTSPIIIDTEGEGFHLTSATNGVLFDIRGDGHLVQIAWTAPGSHNAFLALDRNGDGKVSSGKELFGNFTPQPSSNHPNGFLALEEFDKAENGGNGDNLIDERDEVYSKLRLWIDENHDGIAQPNELHTLPELGVYAISLDYKESRRRDDFGNQFRYTAQVNPRGGRRDERDERSEAGRWAYDVFLTTTTK
jgi:hypothetical protein